MKRNLVLIAVAGLAVLSSCSGDSPQAPRVPTVTPDVWVITSMSASDSNPVVSTVVSVSAVVTKNGAPAPDGTIVEFLSSSGGQFIATGTTEAQVQTDGGTATVSYGATASGSYVVQARVVDTTRQVQIVYSEQNTDDSLAIFTIVPTIGSFDGGETVFLSGKGIEAPVTVSFQPGGTEFQADVLEVVDSSPLSASNGSITLVTPFITDPDGSEDAASDIIVTVRAGLGGGIGETLTIPNGFTFLSSASGGQAPTLFGVNPPYGSSAGGDQVIVLGRNLGEAKIDPSVIFDYQGQQLEAEVLSVSPDGTQILVVTPRFSVVPLTSNQNANLLVTTANGTDTLNNAFVVLADEPQPTITSISPIAGPLDGGTVVTIFGGGFQSPLQVTFGNLSAIDVNLFDDISIADNDRITCVTPDYSQQGGVPPVTVAVTVTNMLTGNIASGVNFTYGDSLFISGNNPTEGRPGDPITIFGSGFEDPLLLFHGPRELEVLDVTGTEIAARFPLDTPANCGDLNSDFRVTLVESNRLANGGNFTLLGNTPNVVSVEPTFVQEEADGTVVDPNDIVILGSNFSEDVLVEIEGFTVAVDDVDVIDGFTIEVDNIPAPQDFNFNFDVESCTTQGGGNGSREAPTAALVTVTNIPGNCTDSLDGALIYVPETDECIVAPDLFVESTPTWPATPVDACSASSINLILRNLATEPDAELTVFSTDLGSDFYFDQVPSSQFFGEYEIPPDSAYAYDGNGGRPDIFFCPTSQSGTTVNGQIVITTNDPNNAVVIINISANVLVEPQISLSPLPVAIDSEWSFGSATNPSCADGSSGDTDTIFLINVGNDTMSIGGIDIVGGDFTEFDIITVIKDPGGAADPVPCGTQSCPAFNLVPNENVEIDIDFCPDAVAGPRTSILTIVHDAVNAPNPIEIDLNGDAL